MVSNNPSNSRYRNGKVFYRGAELLGYSLNEDICYSPPEMGALHQFYERALKQRAFETLEEFEMENGLPKTWLNSVISNMIRDSLNGLNEISKDKGLARELVEEFKDRGYSDRWLKEGQDI